MKRAKSRHGEAMKWLREAICIETDDCIFWPFARHADGRAAVRHEGKTIKVHRLVCALTKGAPPSLKHEAAHSCGNGRLGCVNHRHLRWATRVENEHDKIEHGQTLRGQRNPLAKLTPSAVQIIRANRHVPLRVHAETFGVSVAAICDVRKGRKWAWL